MLACEPVAAGRARKPVGVVACLHALSADWIIQQVRLHHCARVQLASADCSACKRAPRGQNLLQRWQPVAQRLGPSAPRLERITPAKWQEQASDARAPDLARRRLFGRVLAPRLSTGSPLDKSAAADMTSGLGKLVAHLAGHPHARLKPSLREIEIDPMRCTACMVCVSLCAQGAVEHHTDPLQPEGVESIALRHARCTGCDLCTQVCEHAAITIHEPDAMARIGQRPQTIALELFVCSQCKAPFRWPAGRRSDDATASRAKCPICRAGRVHHTQRVVQASDPTAMAAARLP